MYVVTVRFAVNPDQWRCFMPLMLENARLSREHEPGCRQFDVCVDPGQPAVVFLYEVYDDRAAFDLHLASDHFQRFNQATGAMIVRREVQTWSRVQA